MRQLAGTLGKATRLRERDVPRPMLLICTHIDSARPEMMLGCKGLPRKPSRRGEKIGIMAVPI